MPIHAVIQGESLADIALAHGLCSPQPLIDHPDNAELWQTRPVPYILAPGDQVTVPDLELGQVSVPTQARHRFALERPLECVVRLKLSLPKSKAKAGLEFRLTFDGGEIEGQASEEGLIAVVVPVGVKQLELHVNGRTLRLNPNHLNPAGSSDAPDTPGLRSRLTNLGYVIRASGTDEQQEAALAAGLALFQFEHGLEVSGSVNSQTFDALCELHGC